MFRAVTRSVLALAALAYVIAAGAADDDYPNRTVKIVVPFAPGGSTDVVARILADKLGAEFKQSFIVDNRAGASGNIGADAVAKSSPDGYTLLMATTGVLAINQHLFKNQAYDPDRDFVPVSYTSLITNILVVNPEVPARSVAELVRLAKAKPGSLTFASSGSGSSMPKPRRWSRSRSSAWPAPTASAGTATCGWVTGCCSACCPPSACSEGSGLPMR